jgi:hypothetical protein
VRNSGWDHLPFVHVEWAWPLTLWTLKPTLSQLMEGVGSGVGVAEVPFVDILSFQILDVLACVVIWNLVTLLLGRWGPVSGLSGLSV